MKTTLLSILLCVAPAFSIYVRADEPKPDTPKEEKVPAELRERVQAEKAKFHEEMEKHMKAAMEEAAKLEADGKKEEAENLRRQSKEKLQAAIQQHQRAAQEKMEAEMRERAAHQKREGAERERAAGDRREGGDRRPDGPAHAEIEKKLKHVEQAVAHLREAGMPDAAENINRIAERLRASLRGEGEGRREEGRREDARPDAPRKVEVRGEERREDRRPDGDIEALRREIQELRQAVRQLAEKQGGR